MIVNSIFYHRVKEIYRQLVREMGFWEEYRKGREVPVTIGLIYGEYVKKYGGGITLEEFFEKIKQLARQGLIHGLDVHPLYHDDLREWYIVIRPDPEDFLGGVW